MSRPTANCPSCGAKIEFRFPAAVQTVCPYCRSILVRHDLDLTKVGEVAGIPEDASPIQLGAEGVYRNKAFVAVGRIVYTWELGGWNEWHLAFNDGTSGWLSDAQLEYAVTFLAKPDRALPAQGEVRRGMRFASGGVEYMATTLTPARYAGVEGELPFEYWDKTEFFFADLRTQDARFATIDYSEQPPLYFAGEFVEFDALRFKNLREFEGWTL
jgi:hypothetical protein